MLTYSEEEPKFVKYLSGYAGAFYGGKAAQTTETTESKSQMERDITRSMFAIRMAEMRAAWFKNRSGYFCFSLRGLMITIVTL